MCETKNVIVTYYLNVIVSICWLHHQNISRFISKWYCYIFMCSVQWHV